MKALPWIIGGTLVTAPLVARAQVRAQLQELQDPSAEAELPDVDALERGGRPRASVSFRQAQPAPEGSPTAGASRTVGVNGVGTGTELPAGGLYGVEALTVGETTEVRRGPVPEVHVVKKGDTLWSLCDSYFGDPWRWPKLWSENPLITNPHWIFPGDTVRLRTAGAAPVDETARASTGRVLGHGGPATSMGARLREIGFIDISDFSVAARISGSREEKILLATGDQAYVQFRKDRPLRAGERYTVFHADTKNPLRDGRGRTLGYLVRVYGDLTVEQIAENETARGTLVGLTEPVERGYAVGPRVLQFRTVEPRPATSNLEAKVVASFTPTALLAAENFVVLDRGRKDGIVVGNRSFVVRRGDGYRGQMEAWDAFDPRFPKEVVGEVWVVNVTETASVAWIARSSKEVRVGETVELRKGH